MAAEVRRYAFQLARPYIQAATMGAEARKSSPAVIIRSSELLTTTTTTSGGTIKLTSLDRGFVKLPFVALLMFEPMGHEAIETIKRALSQALVHYYPFAGHIIPSSGAIINSDENEGFSIRCTDDGVEFVTASVGCSLKEAKILDESTGAMLDELAIFYPEGSYGFDDPLLSVQVTEFSCGSLVLGVTWNHAIADGIGIAQVLAAVGELARGSPSPSVVPARWDDAVSKLLHPWPDPILEAMLVCPESQDMELLVPLDITIPSALINRVKAEYHRSCSFDGQPCTAFEVVLAILWRCRIRATMCNNPEGNPVYLTSATNMRKYYVSAKDGYYGNCVSNHVLAVATRGVVAEAGIVDLVRMIKMKTGNDGNDNQLTRGLVGRYDMMHVTSWRNNGFEQVDFGSGTPARVMCHMRERKPPVPMCIMYPPCKGKDGVNLLSLSVKEEHADAFLGELSKHT